MAGYERDPLGSVAEREFYARIAGLQTRIADLERYMQRTYEVPSGPGGGTDFYDKAQSDSRYINVAGDTMTGALGGTAITLSGTLIAATLQGALDWSYVANKPDPVITLSGDLGGSVTLTDLGSGTLTATIQANSVALGTDTTGNYVAGATGTTNQVTVSGTPGEGWSPTFALPQNIHTGATPQFARLGLGIAADATIALYVSGTARVTGAATLDSSLTVGTTLGVTGVASFTSNAQSNTYASRTTGWAATAAGGGDFRNLFADQLTAKAFVVDQTAAYAGSLVIAKSASTLSRAFTSPATGGTGTLFVRDLTGAADMQVFQNGDSVVLRNINRSAGAITIADCVGVVTAYADLSGGEQSYTFTRNASTNGGAASTGLVYPIDAPVIDYGTTGFGVIDMTTLDGTYSANSPYFDVRTWTTAPVAGNFASQLRLGRLGGLTADSTEYGLMSGVYSTRTSTGVLRSSTVGLELYNATIKLHASGTETVRLDPAVPSFAMGNALPTGVATGTGIWMGLSSSVYKFRVGNPAGQQMLWDGTSLLITGAIGGGSIDIGGDDTTSFHVDSAGAAWMGASVANKATAPLRISSGGDLLVKSFGLLNTAKTANVLDAQLDTVAGGDTASLQMRSDATYDGNLTWGIGAWSGYAVELNGPASSSTNAPQLSMGTNSFGDYYATMRSKGASGAVLSLRTEAGGNIAEVTATDIFLVGTVQPTQWPGWTAVSTFANGWSHYGGGWRSARYRKIGDEVYVEGMIYGGTVGPAVTALTLPAGYRPAASQQPMFVTTAEFHIDSNGVLSVRTTPANGYVPIGCHFSTL